MYSVTKGWMKWDDPKHLGLKCDLIPTLRTVGFLER